MLTQQENDRLTRIGPGAPMGALMRRYWIPALFASQLPAPDCSPVRVKLLSERLVAFRDTHGRIGLLDERCPHRTASLFFGRNEEDGLRCAYHGWKFDVHGRCLDTPSEPRDSNLCSRVRQTAYPCLEQGGIIWTYMGPPEFKPQFPNFEWAQVPESHRFATRHVQECNWLQGLEGGFDTSHLSFLHRGDTALSVPTRYEVLATAYGFVAGTGRDGANGKTTWSANVMLMPFHKLIATNPIGAHMWVPIDDENTMLYSIEYMPNKPLEAGELERARSGSGIHTQNLPGTDFAVLNRSNDYMIDRALQSSGKSYTGIKGLAMQDCGIQESMGPIADRTIEHLGISDTVIVRMRRFLLRTLKEFEDGAHPPGLDPATHRVRSALFTVAREQDFKDAVDGFVRTDEPARAQEPAH
jgi:phthalate 4,5-dioxygenase